MIFRTDSLAILFILFLSVDSLKLVFPAIKAILLFLSLFIGFKRRVKKGEWKDLNVCLVSFLLS